MKNSIKKISAAVVLLMLLSSTLVAQKTEPVLTQGEKQTVIDSISSKLNSTYVFPETAKNMADKLKTNLKAGDYAGISDPQAFATRLTDDLQGVSKDKHINVRFDPEGIAERQQAVTPADSIAFRNRYIAGMKRNNFGFKEIKILGGNIGYLDLRNFSDVSYGGETAVAAMNFLSSADAIIIDLRYNGGGSPSMIQLISSYLFGPEAVHLNNFYWRPTDSNSQTWTLPHVSGNRSADTPVYVLTSNRTFSAAEEFSYNLKNLKRATLVGETTGGGAHPGGTVIATDRFTIWVPTGRAINPITNTNWEGTGVSPHIEVKAEDALTVAHMKALETFAAKNKGTELESFYSWPIAALKAKHNPLKLEESKLKSYVGVYGPRVITFENGKLFYQRDEGTKYELLPYSDSEFMLIGLDYFRVKFLSENNKVTAIEGHYDSGRVDKNLKG